MSAGFTPGPWEVEKGGHFGPTLVGADDEGGKWGEWVICDMSLPVDLVGLNEDNISQDIIDQQTANARLIAAAPELYEACEAAEFLLAALCVERDSDTRVKLRSAIAKVGASHVDA